MKKLRLFISKTLRLLLSAIGRGSVLPGWLIERSDADFVPRVLSTLPHGTVLVSGHSEYALATKMVIELLERQGLRVFIDTSGSNSIHSIATALVGAVNRRGEIDADIAVLHLGSANGTALLKRLKPRYSLLLDGNHLDTSLQLARATTDTVVVNREDPQLVAATIGLTAPKVFFFGYGSALRPTAVERTPAVAVPSARVIVKSTTNTAVTFALRGKLHTATLRVHGMHNMLCAAAALALVQTITPRATPAELLHALAHIEPKNG